MKEEEFILAIKNKLCIDTDEAKGNIIRMNSW
jgi:hypothetical protein